MEPFTGFNFDANSCSGCKLETNKININLRDAEDIVAEFYSVIKNAKSEDELYSYLLEFYDAASDNEVKHYIHEEITLKLGDLHDMEIDVLDDEGDLVCNSRCHCK
ncbi:hypothetical protein [Brevibacillus brevis]|uniref:hypothetical protein n=1 Tax=Brevibacillus brevis TaxID=1393 RepID=UPI0007D8A57F|nr:hypothetical protein [Brevibacillus brevis]